MFKKRIIIILPIRVEKAGLHSECCSLTPSTATEMNLVYLADSGWMPKAVNLSLSDSSWKEKTGTAL